MTTPAPSLPPIAVRRPPRVRGIATLWRRLVAMIPRPPTLEEKREQAAQRAQELSAREMERALAAEAERAAAMIVDTLESLNICYRYSDGKRVKKIKLARPYGLHPDMLIFSVDFSPRHRPRGIGVEHFGDDVLRNLSVVLGRKVDFRYAEATGAMLIVYRREGMSALPSHVRLDDMMALRPASADALSIPIGMAAGGRPIWRSFSQMVSVLVAGTTGGGKSNWLRVALSVLLYRNSPRRLKIALVDLKEGVEFGPYAQVPHLATYGEARRPAIITHRDDVLPFLESLIAEGERRLRLLRESGHVKLSQYNHHRGTNALPDIILFIDEWADIKLAPKIGPAAQEALINVASRFRAAGIHLVLCTQYPKSEVVSMRLRAVLPAKIAFSMPTMAASVMVLNSGVAFELKEKGRAVYQWASETIVTQTPYISNERAQAVIEQIRAGLKYDDAPDRRTPHDVTVEELLEWALTENGGRLPYRDVLAYFRGRGMTEPAARDMIATLVGHEYIIGAARYRVERPVALNGAPRLVLLDDDDPGPGDDNMAGAVAVDEITEDASPALDEFFTDDSEIERGDADADPAAADYAGGGV